jgi:hypothetical protein
MNDGALLAWKTSVIRSALSDEACSIGSAGGPGAPSRQGDVRPTCTVPSGTVDAETP